MNKIALLAICGVLVVGRGGAGGADGLQWHCHSLGKPKVLYLAGSPNNEMFAEQLRHVVPADVAFAPLLYGDQEMHHLCDKPLEESKEDQAYVLKEGAAYFDGLVARMREFQVVIAQFPVRSNDKAESERLVATQKALADYARSGGKLVVINPGWEAVYEGTPLEDVLPIRSGKGKSWVYSCGPATDHPLSRGIPLEVTGAHFYGPIYEPADATCLPLTDNGKLTRFWHRRLPSGGEVVHLFQVGGERHQWRGENAALYDPERPDDGTAWNAFYRRLVYGLAFGDKAFPALVSVSAKPSRAGNTLAASVTLENHSDAPREIVISFDARHRRSPDGIRMEKKVAVAKGQSVALQFAPEVNLPCTDAWLLVTARALDADGRTVVSESMAWAPYIHRVPLTVKTDKASYAPGETITATITWAPDAEEGDYLPVAYVVDSSGRALTRAAFEVTGERTATAKLTMPDRGPEFVGSYWVTAVFSKGDQIAGLARAQVQLDQPWTMRERFEWSVWTWGGGGRFIDLIRDAGFNALGCMGNPYTADRYGMRQYVEGTGINTFGVTIDHDNWEAVRAAMHKTIERHNQGAPDARSKSLVSLGEESGFKDGWGMRYYWPEDKAPAVPQKVFGEHLRERYAGRLDVLNQEWGTSFASFDDIPLEKAKVKSPGQVFVTSQAWEAMQKKGETKPVIPVNLARLDPKQRYIGHSAPYWETYNFFDWYYQKYCDLATEVYRSRRNPVPLTIMSAPGGFYPKVDVYNFAGLGPFYPKEAALVGNAIARRDYGDIPGFSAAMWAYFDLRSLWNCTVMSSILAGNTHIDYWVDVPLTFNADLTHTRASFWTKELREQLRPIEPILLHKRFAYTDGLGMLVGQQPLPKGILGQHFGSAIDCNAPIYSALEETGYMPKVVHAKDLKGIKVLVASHAQVLSTEEGKAIADFVKGGGLLISTPWLASCSPHGNAFTVYPAEETGLAELLGFRLLNTSQAVVKEEANLPQVWNLREVVLVSKGKDNVLDMAPDVEVLAKHKDGTPLILTREVGKGRVVYLNFIYDWDNWWNSFHEPAREAYRRLIDAIIRSDGRVKAEYFIAFESAEPCDDNKGWWQTPLKSKPNHGEAVPWWSSQLYSDPSGRIKYLAIFSDHRSPAISATVRWADPNVRVFDLLSVPHVKARAANSPKPDAQGAWQTGLRPGGAALFAIVRQAPAEVRLRAMSSVVAGQPVRVAVTIKGVERDACYGLGLDVVDPSGNYSRKMSLASVQAPGGKTEFLIPTALNDPPGEYRILATEAITCERGQARFRLREPSQAPSQADLTPFPSRPSEAWPAISMTTAEFLGELRKLRAVYEGGHAGLEAKYMLSYYLNVPFRPDNRHAIMRRLQRTDWAPHVEALAEATRAGERFLVLPEDLNHDPGSGLWIDPFSGLRLNLLFRELLKQPGARTRLLEGLPVPLSAIEIGNGALMYPTQLESPDRSAYHSSDFAVWHERLKKALKEIR
ncbi:MAG TPA: beta-galactosidase trimerization domain-containing protein [Planctomycetota bacterium]|nr:beta-galactosidase trimerization domain-containing protein [Planctomycetota bacterium]HRR80435.1 beta-galactosidase trimerization domain-containing protein [Planctomycetota bacterium]HRT94125.1 beta-galactosidase trimerization domain-containing protein [Planctomycetota bacterium]